MCDFVRELKWRKARRKRKLEWCYSNSMTVIKLITSVPQSFCWRWKHGTTCFWKKSTSSRLVFHECFQLFNKDIVKMTRMRNCSKSFKLWYIVIHLKIMIFKIHILTLSIFKVIPVFSFSALCSSQTHLQYLIQF